MVLSEERLNNGPQSLASILPAGWEGRLRPAFAGRAVTLATLGRADLLKTKRFALSDRGTDILRIGNDFQVARRGEDERFAGTSLRVPAGTLRDRAADVLSPRELARRHAGYRNRVLMGPTWRADVWSVLVLNPKLTPAETARQVGCAFSTAWQVVQDFALYREVSAASRRRRN